MTLNPFLKNFVIVLTRPRMPENIGAAARAASNMGIGKLIVVDPENLDSERMLKMATHKAAYLVKEMKIHPDLKSALSGFNYIVGATARTGGIRRPVFSPREIAPTLLQTAPKNHIALVFGSEDRGLTNEEIRYCHQLVKIPTAKFSSLNLAQAVMIIGYEIFLASLTPIENAIPHLATSRELELMYEKVKEILIKISFIQPENPEHWMMNIRRFFSRIGLRSHEVNLIMGICRQIGWFGKTRLEGERITQSSEKNGDIAC